MKASRSISDPSSDAATDADELVMELEIDELNQHECMSSLISVIRYMQLNNITPTVEQVTTTTRA